MTKFYIIRDNEIVGTAPTQKDALIFVNSYQSKETERYYFGEVSYSIIEGGDQVYIPYPDKGNKAKTKRKA